MNLMDLYVKVAFDDGGLRTGIDSSIKSSKKLTSQVDNAVSSVDALKAKVNILGAEHQQAAKDVIELTAALKKSIAETGYDSDETKSLSKQVDEAAANEKQLRDELEKASYAAKHNGKSAEEVKAQWEKAGKALKRIGSAAAAFGAAAFAVGAAFVKGASDTAAYGDEVDKMSQKIGLSAEGYQKWRYVLGQSGGDINNMQMGMKTLASAAYDGSEAFEAIGISIEDAKSLSTEDLFEKTISQLASMEAGTERTALATDLFGRSATDIMPMLNSGAESIEALKKQAEDYGLIMSQDAVDASAKFGDSVSLMQQTLTGMKNRMMGEFLPAITLVTDGLAKLFTGDTSGLDGINKGIGQFVDKIAQAIPQIITVGGSILQALASAIMQNMPLLVTAAFDLISQFAGFVLDNLPMLIETALTILSTLALGIAEQAPTLIPAIVQTVITIINTLIENIPMLIDAAVQLMTGLMNGIVAAIPLLVAAAPQIIISLIKALVANLPTLLASAADIIVAIVTGLIAAIPQLIEAVPQILMALVQAFADLAPKVADIGLNMVKGIFNGISNAVSWLYGKLRGWVRSVLSYIKNLFGIKSPSTVMREEVGKMLSFGLGDGILKYAGYAKNAMAELMEGVMGETYSPTISASVSGSTGLYGDALAGAGAMGGVTIGAVNFNQPLQSTTQAAKLFARKLTGELYA